MDPLRRLLLLGVLASVILTEPGSARAAHATMADLAGRSACRDAAAVLAGEMIQRLAVVLQQEEQDAKLADGSRRDQRHVTSEPDRPACVAQVGCVHACLSPHEFRPPPPHPEG